MFSESKVVKASPVGQGMSVKDIQQHIIIKDHKSTSPSSSTCANMKVIMFYPVCLLAVGLDRDKPYGTNLVAVQSKAANLPAGYIMMVI